MSTPLTWIEAPARTPRPNTSLDVLPVHDVSAEHFVGFQYVPEPCSFPNNLPQGCYVQVGPPAGTAKTFNDTEDALVTEVFGAYHGIECYLNGGIDNFREMARNVLENGEYRVVDEALSAVLEAAAASIANPTTVVAGLALLEQALADQVPALGYIYVSPTVATYLAKEGLLIRNIDGTLETYLGTPVVILTALASALVAYASGPVNLWRSPIEVNDAPNWTVNLGRALAERLYSLAIECGAWKVTFPAPTGTQNPPDPDEPLAILLGSIPSSPIPDGTDTTIIAQTNVTPTAEVVLWYSVNGGADVEAGEMTQTNPHEFVWNVVGDATGPGDSVELWAVSEYDGAPVESNHITIEVT